MPWSPEQAIPDHRLYLSVPQTGALITSADSSWPPSLPFHTALEIPQPNIFTLYQHGSSSQTHSLTQSFFKCEYDKDDYAGKMMFREPMGLKFPDICLRPGADQSSKAAFCKSAFAKSKLTFGKSAFARSRFSFRQSIFASQKAMVWPSATSKMLSP